MTSGLSFASALTADQAARILESGPVRTSVGALLPPPLVVRSLFGRRSDAFAVRTGDREYVVRFPADRRRLAMLRLEERLHAGLRATLNVTIPDTRVVTADSELPVFAIHTLIPGRTWFDFDYTRTGEPARDRLATDLSRFLLAVHATPLATAAEWLTASARMAERQPDAKPDGKPPWFGPKAAALIRDRLRHHMDSFTSDLFADTADRYAAITVSRDELVFGHGDLHGGNITLVEDEIGPRLTGVLDFENAGIFDVHYDFGRLNLIDCDLQSRIIVQYQAESARFPRLDVDRIDVYGRAFMFYLMGEQVGVAAQMSPARTESYAKLVTLLRRQVEHSRRRPS